MEYRKKTTEPFCDILDYTTKLPAFGNERAGQKIAINFINGIEKITIVWILLDCYFLCIKLYTKLDRIRIQVNMTKKVVI